MAILAKAHKSSRPSSVGRSRTAIARSPRSSTDVHPAVCTQSPCYPHGSSGSNRVDPQHGLLSAVLTVSVGCLHGQPPPGQAVETTACPARPRVSKQHPWAYSHRCRNNTCDRHRSQLSKQQLLSHSTDLSEQQVCTSPPVGVETTPTGSQTSQVSKQRLLSGHAEVSEQHLCLQALAHRCRNNTCELSSQGVETTPWLPSGAVRWRVPTLVCTY